MTPLGGYAGSTIAQCKQRLQMISDCWKWKGSGFTEVEKPSPLSCIMCGGEFWCAPNSLPSLSYGLEPASGFIGFFCQTHEHIDDSGVLAGSRVEE